jgi:hypothetical protein
MAECEWLRDPHLNITADPPDGEVARMVDILAHGEPVDRLEGLTRVLEELASCPPSPDKARSRTLDLIGHSDEARLLHLGSSVVDPRVEGVRRLFEKIAADGLLQRLNITELRLLGCETAMSVDGQTAIRALTEVLGIPVLGTTKLLYAAYFGEDGLRRRYEPVLCHAANLPELAQPLAEWPRDPLPSLAPPFQLDIIRSVSIDELPVVDWPRVRRIARTDREFAGSVDARPLLDLIEPGSGRMLPRLLAQPRCELLLMSGGDRVRRIEILFDFELVRIQLVDTTARAVYRVKNARELEDWVASVGFDSLAHGRLKAHRIPIVK